MKIFSRLFKQAKGMTLIEIMIVVGIIAFLFTVVGQAVNKRRKKAQISQAKIVIGLLEQAISEFNYDCGFYPRTLQDLSQAPEDCKQWGPEAYVKNGKVPKDPWNQEFSYEFDDETNNYEIISFGADRRPGGDNFNKDISSAE